MIDLKAEYGKRYRIVLDQSADIEGQTREERLWLQRIKCRRGHVYVHGENTLGAYCDKAPSIKRLLNLPFVKPHQRGDKECSATFAPRHLEQVLEILSPYCRRQVSEARRQQLLEAGANSRFSSRLTGTK